MNPDAFAGDGRTSRPAPADRNKRGKNIKSGHAGSTRGDEFRKPVKRKKK